MKFYDKIALDYHVSNKSFNKSLSPIFGKFFTPFETHANNT